MEETGSLTREEKQYIRMTETPTMKLVCALGTPTVISMLVTSVYNLADTFFVSQLGTCASGAVSIVFSLQSLIQAIGFGFGMGAGSLAAMRLGQKRDRDAAVYASSAFAAALLAGALLGGLCLSLLAPVMTLFGANGEILPYACTYSRYILYGAPLMCATFVLNLVLRTSGKPNLSMIGIMSGAVLNIILDPIFIMDFGLGMGIAGAALATLIGQLVSFLILLSFYLRKVCLVPIQMKYVSLRFSTYRDIVLTGLPTVCRQGVASLATMLLNNRARLYGSAAIAAMGIANRIYLLIRSVIVGVGQGFQPVAGYNFGAGKYARVREAFRDAAFLGSLFATAAAVLMAVFAPNIISLFLSDDPEVVLIGTRALRFLCCSLPGLAYSTHVNQLLQCLSRVKSATFLALCRNGIFYVPLILALPHFFGLTGIELTQPLADVMTFLVSIPFQVVFFTELKTYEKTNQWKLVHTRKRGNE